jgi:hypothetical protein
MIVPQYWAEAIVKTVVDGRHWTIKRFGWSDASEAEAQDNARKRAEDAIALVEAGEKVRRVDHKVPYNSGDGLPIREEVISRHGDAVITRNGYGALCLNTPNVMFADIDFAFQAGVRLTATSFAMLAAVALGYSIHLRSWGAALGLLFLAAIFTSTLAAVLLRIVTAARGGHERLAARAVEAFSRNNPDWGLRLYRTPMGYRILVMHATFDPRGEDARRFLSAVHADRQFVQLCRSQNCFRARISAKPWRIGLSRLEPRPGVWPVKPERMEARRAWVSRYEQAAQNFAACRFIRHLGSTRTDAEAEYVRALHDEYCRTDADLQLA